MKILLSTLFLYLCVTTGFGQPESSRIELMQYAHTLYAADSLEKALVAYQKVAYAKFDGGLLVDSLSGYALHRMGVCAYYLSKSEDAKRYYQGAIAVRDIAFAKPHNEQAKSRVNLARVFIEQGALDSAAYYLHAAIERLEVTALPDFSLYETVLTELIQVASGLGDSQMALAAARRARFIFENFHGSIAADKAAMMYYDISVSLLYLDQFEQSKLHALAALDINQGLGDNRRVGLCYQSLAAIAERSNNFQDAIQYLQLALVFTLTEDQQSLSYLHHSLARNQLHLGNLPAAETHLRTAEANVPPGDLLHSHNAKLRALLLAASGKPAPALKFFNTAVALLDSSGTYEGDLLVVHPPAVIKANLDLLALHLTDRAAFLADQGRYRDALRDYGTVLQIRERLRRDVSSGGSRERLSTNLRPLLDDAIEVCHRLYKQGQEEMAWQALQFSEWARAYDLLRSYRRGGAANVEMEPWSKIAKLERQVVMDSTVQTALSDARLRLDRLVRRQGIHDTTALQPLDHDRLQNYLSQHHARLLLYHLTDSSAYRFELAEDGQLALERLPVVGAELTEAVIQWRTAIAESAYRRKSMRNRQAQEKLDRSYLTDGQQLADKLDLQASAVPTILIPDGILHALPFAALPLGQATTHVLHYDSIDYLGDHAPLSFGYSIATLLAQEEPRTDTYSLDLLAFAPAFAPNTLPLLPLSHEEAAAVCDRYTSHELLVDGQANRTNFTTRAPTARILHLSTHGSANLENPNLSYVAFTQTGGPSDPDERLYYNELSALHLPAELVVLSACETSIGKPVPGETVASLATAFAAAGAHSTLTTLWQVDERATLELVRHFYDRLAQGGGRQEALYYAQQRLRHSADYAHPYYWAGLALHGSIGSLSTSSAPAAPPYWLPVAVLLVAAGIGLALRAKQTSHAEQRTAPVQ